MPGSSTCCGSGTSSQGSRSSRESRSDRGSRGSGSVQDSADEEFSEGSFTTVDEDSEVGERPGGFIVLSPGEVVSDRFRVIDKLGCGHFGNVFRVADEHDGGALVALKVYKSRYVRMAREEAELLRMVVAGSRHVVALRDSGAIPEREWAVDLSTVTSSSSSGSTWSSSEYSGGQDGEDDQDENGSTQGSSEETAPCAREHVWLSLELMGPDLKSLLRMKEQGIGQALTRLVTTHVLRGLVELEASGVVHTDIKPENILCPAGVPIDVLAESALADPERHVFKLCDVGSGLPLSEIDPEDCCVMQTHDYRSPEVMIGYCRGHAMDLWSTGCCVFEMLTGERLFDIREEETELGRDFELLGLFMELLGPLPQRMVLNGKKARRLVARSGKVKHARCRNVTEWPLESVLREKYAFDAQNAKAAAEFMLKMLQYNPNVRTRPKVLLEHPWLRR